AAHLEHDVALVELRHAPDHLEDVVVDQEVLAELAVGPDAELAQAAKAALAERTHQPNTRAALRSTTRSSSSYATPRSSATCSAVSTTFAGSFGFPRTGCGLRYGASVSTRSRSSGTSRAAAWRSVAFGYVTLPAKEHMYPRATHSSSRDGAEKQWRITVRPSACSRSVANVSSSASRVWITSGSPVRRATSICASNARRWSSRGARSRK